jgi:S-adenosylmethionine synthetase
MIVIEPFKGKSVADQEVEIVERKGVGHPDSLCDAMMEAVSLALCREYLREFGTILHHNIDKGLLAAGRTRKRFGGGEVLAPMELIIGDRATFSARGKKIPVADIAVAAAKTWLTEQMRFVDPERHLRYRVVLAPASEELTDIFSRPGSIKSANDTSAAVGYFPLSPTETAVLALERHLNSKPFKKKHPETGEDIKVMGVRTGTELDLTVAMPILARYAGSEQAYFERKEVLLREMQTFANRLQGFRKARIHFNTLDEAGRGLGGVYLSLLGTSAEDADSGQVGRGNRVNGLIPVSRPLGSEAAAGKNPVSHVGKIYTVLSHRIAEKLYRGIDGAREVYVYLVSRIGAPIDRPQVAAAQIALQRGLKVRDVARRAEDIIVAEFSTINTFCRALSEGKYPVC